MVGVMLRTVSPVFFCSLRICVHYTFFCSASTYFFLLVLLVVLVVLLLVLVLLVLVVRRLVPLHGRTTGEMLPC
tara:strand:- start:144 stop:365 length:222 start_codon:yes stop_codon:yes gene_type:complete